MLDCSGGLTLVAEPQDPEALLQDGDELWQPGGWHQSEAPHFTWNGEWRTYSDYRLAVELEADGSKEEELQYLGPRLVRNLSVRAWESCIEIDREKLKTKAGFEYLLQFLREKRGKQQVDLLGDALGKYFQSGEAVRKDAESLSDYELRHGALLRDMTKAMKEVGASNTVPSEIFGWFVLNQLIRLDPRTLPR